MSIDPKEAINLAFEHLDTFSLPGIGTFSHRREPAWVDRASGKVRPPVERFHLEAGETHTEALTDFFFRRYKLSIGKAEELVREAAATLAAAAESPEGLVIHGVGRIKKEGDAFLLDPEALEGNDDLFGLQELEFKLAKGFRPDEEAKKKAAALEIEQRKAPEHLISKKPRKKKRAIWPFVLIILLLGLAGGGYIYLDEIKAWFNSDSSTTVASGDSSDTDVDTTGHLAMTDPVDTSGTDTELIEDPIMDDDPEEPIEPVVTDTDVGEDSGTDADIGVFARKGKFYLVIASGRNPGAVKEGARRNKAKILRPRYKGNYYRLSVYEDTDKNKVIAKMVELEDKYPKSWIYYLGM